MQPAIGSSEVVDQQFAVCIWAHPALQLGKQLFLMGYLQVGIILCLVNLGCCFSRVCRAYWAASQLLLGCAGRLVRGLLKHVGQTLAVRVDRKSAGCGAEDPRGAYQKMVSSGSNMLA